MAECLFIFDIFVFAPARTSVSYSTFFFAVMIDVCAASALFLCKPNSLKPRKACGENSVVCPTIVVTIARRNKSSSVFPLKDQSSDAHGLYRPQHVVCGNASLPTALLCPVNIYPTSPISSPVSVLPHDTSIVSLTCQCYMASRKLSPRSRLRNGTEWECVEVLRAGPNPRWRCKSCLTDYTGAPRRIAQHILGVSRVNIACASTIMLL